MMKVMIWIYDLKFKKEKNYSQTIYPDKVVGSPLFSDTCPDEVVGSPLFSDILLLKK